MHNFINDKETKIKFFLERLGNNSPTDAQMQWAVKDFNGKPIYRYFSTKKESKEALHAPWVFIRILARSIQAHYTKRTEKEKKLKELQQEVIGLKQEWLSFRHNLEIYAERDPSDVQILDSLKSTLRKIDAEIKEKEKLIKELNSSNDSEVFDHD